MTLHWASAAPPGSAAGQPAGTPAAPPGTAARGILLSVMLSSAIWLGLGLLLLLVT